MFKNISTFDTYFATFCDVDNNLIQIIGDK